jgi:hypothetical protein
MKTSESRQVKTGEENLLDNLNRLVIMAENWIFSLFP